MFSRPTTQRICIILLVSITILSLKIPKVHNKVGSSADTIADKKFYLSLSFTSGDSDKSVSFAVLA